MQYTIMVCDHENDGSEFSIGPFPTKTLVVLWLLKNKFKPISGQINEEKEGQWKRNRGTHLYDGEQKFIFTKELWAEIVPILEPDSANFRDFSS